MWFKQIQIWQLSAVINYAPEALLSKLEPLAFKPCLPTMSQSIGWAPILDDEASPLLQSLNGYIMFCMQIEEKILPRTVVRQELANRAKQIETNELRKIRKKEKLSLEDEIILTLLPRAFTKSSRIYGYIDTKRHWLVLNTSNTKKAELFLSLFKKSVSEEIEAVHIEGVSAYLTDWLKNKNYPAAFNVEKNTVLQDKDQQNRIIRCQQQDLFANSIQDLLKDGCHVKQLALTWHDRVHFVLTDTFTLRNVQYEDTMTDQLKVEDAATALQKFNSDFFVMTETLTQLLTELLSIFKHESTLSRNMSNEAVMA